MFISRHATTVAINRPDTPFSKLPNRAVGICRRSLRTRLRVASLNAHARLVALVQVAERGVGAGRFHAGDWMPAVSADCSRYPLWSHPIAQLMRK